MNNIKKPNAQQLIGGAIVMSLGFGALIKYSWAW